MKKRIAAIIATTIIILLLLSYLMVGNPVIFYHNQQLKNSITDLDDKQVITLNEFVPFDWDIVYTFAPYTTKEEIEEVIGFQSNFIRETVNEGMVQLLFVNDKSVTASVCGYASNLGYHIVFDSTVTFEDKILFDVEVSSDSVKLTQQ